MGRILTINDEIKLDGTVDGDYSKDMTKSVVASGKELENVLIIGGANTLYIFFCFNFTFINDSQHYLWFYLVSYML